MHHDVRMLQSLLRAPDPPNFAVGLRHSEDVAPLCLDPCFEAKCRGCVQEGLAGGFGAARVLLAGVDVVTVFVDDATSARTHLSLTSERHQLRQQHPQELTEDDSSGAVSKADPRDTQRGRAVNTPPWPVSRDRSPAPTRSACWADVECVPDLFCRTLYDKRIFRKAGRHERHSALGRSGWCRGKLALQSRSARRSRLRFGSCCRALYSADCSTGVVALRRCAIWRAARNGRVDTHATEMRDWNASSGGLRSAEAAAREDIC